MRGYIDAGEAEGAKLVVDGRTFKMDRQGYENGYYHRRHAVRRGDTRHDDLKEEIFGPVLFDRARQELADAVDLINSHEYANGVAIFTRDGDSARAFAHEIEVGMVGVNVPIPVPMAFH